MTPRQAYALLELAQVRCDPDFQRLTPGCEYARFAPLSLVTLSYASGWLPDCQTLSDLYEAVEHANTLHEMDLYSEQQYVEDAAELSREIFYGR